MTTAYLVAFDGNQQASETDRRLLHGDRPWRIGRANDNDLVLNDPQVSRYHAELRWDGQHWHLLDRGSANGTMVNNTRIQQQLLLAGDTITIGNWHWRFEPQTPSLGLLDRLAAHRSGSGGQLPSPAAVGWWPLNESRPLQIGRAVDNDLVVDDPLASRHHAEVRRDGQNWRLIDHGSANGTLINGVRVVNQLLQPGDTITIGDRQLVVTPHPGHDQGAQPPSAGHQPPVVDERVQQSSQPSPGNAQAPAAAPGSQPFALECPACQRAVDPHYQDCPWCGAALAHGRTLHEAPLPTRRLDQANRERPGNQGDQS